MNAGRLHALAAALGAGSVAFGLPPLLAPRFCGRVFGFASINQPDVVAAFRSIGARDVAIGYGLWRAAQRGEDVAPWLLARLICDTTDTVGCAIAIGEGNRHPRFLTLTSFAALAAAGAALLFQQARTTTR